MAKHSTTASLSITAPQRSKRPEKSHWLFSGHINTQTFSNLALHYSTTSYIPSCTYQEAARPACLCPAGLGGNRNSSHSLSISRGPWNCKEDKLTSLSTVCYKHNMLFFPFCILEEGKYLLYSIPVT